MAIAILDTYNTLPPVKAVRRARRAYIGLLGMAFERAADRADILRAKGDDLLVDLTKRGEVMEDTAKSAFDTVKAKAEDLTDDGIKAAKTIMPLKTLTGKAAKIAALEAQITAMNAKLKAETKPAKKKAAPKAKPIKVKTVETEIKTEQTKVDTADKYAAYFQKVTAYDADADAGYVRTIVNHLGIALQSRDGQLVACSDSAERDTVRDNWLVKKLGVSGETEALDAKVLSVCETMKADRMKDRVVFYYLLAKQEGKLAAL